MQTLEQISSDFLINNFREALVIIDNDGLVLSANKRVEEVLGYSAGEIAGKQIDFIFRNRHLEFHDMLRFLEVDELTFEETVLVRKNRKHIHARLRIKRHPDTGMQVIYITNVDQKIQARLDVERKVSSVEKLTRSRHIRNGQFGKAIEEILQQSSRTLGVNRVNAWLADKEFYSIRCIGSYVADTKSFHEEKGFTRDELPAYFDLLQTEEAIVCHNTATDPKVKELIDIYIRPYSITSMMDIPIRIDGKMAGVICFEHTGPKRTWDIHEQKYALFVAQLISLALETEQKQNSNRELQTLLKEVNHRTKNNINIAISLLKLQADNARDTFHRELFEECTNRLYSIASLHQHLYQTSSFARVELADYLEKITKYVQESFNLDNKISLKFSGADVAVNITKAVSLGLITNELLTNAYKHAFSSKSKGKINISVWSEGKKAFLMVCDNGKGITDADLKKETLGTMLIRSLAAQADGKVTWKSEKGTQACVEFLL